MSSPDDSVVQFAPSELPAWAPRHAVALRLMTSALSPAARFGWTVVADELATAQPGDLVVIATQSGNQLQEVVRLTDKTLAVVSPTTGGSARSFSLGSVAVRTVVALIAPGTWTAVPGDGEVSS